MKAMFVVALTGALLAGQAAAQSAPASPSAAHSQLAAVVSGTGFHDGWAMHLPSPRTTAFNPAVTVRSDGECSSVVSAQAGPVQYDWRQVVRLRSSSSSRLQPDGSRIPLEYLDVSFGPSAPTLRLFFHSKADRDSAVAAARYLGQRCNPTGFTG